MGALPDFVKTIALNNKLDESRDFATIVQRAMVEQLTPANKALKDLGVKQAPFVVLIGAAMPSVLAEISFLTNAAGSEAAEGRRPTGSGSPKRCSTRSGSIRRRSRPRRNVAHAAVVGIGRASAAYERRAAL